MAKSSKCELLHWDGAKWSALQAVETPGGTLRTDQPPLEVSSEVCDLIRPGLYVLRADSLTLRTEADFHRARRRVVLGSMFENNSETMELVKNGAVIVCVVVAILLWFQLGPINNELQHVAAVVDKLNR